MLGLGVQQTRLAARPRLLARATAVQFFMGTFVALWLIHEDPDGADWLGNLGLSVSYSAFVLAGLWITHQRPANRMGWLFLFIGGVAGLAFLFESWAEVGPSGESLDGTRLAAAWAVNFLWVPSVFLPLTLVPLLFPTGSPPGPAWRHLRTLVVIVACAAMLNFAFVTTELDNAPNANPLAIPGLSSLDTITSPILSILWALCTIACLASPFVRFRAATLIERQQLRWFAWASAAGVVLLALNGVVFYGNLLFHAAILVIVLSVALAVLRYRLWDLDLVVARIAGYAAATSLVAAFYGGAIFVAGFSVVPGGTLFAGALTAAAAAIAFQPIQHRANRLSRRLVRPPAQPAPLAWLSEELVETRSLEEVRSAVARVASASFSADAGVHDSVPAGKGSPASILQIEYGGESYGWLTISPALSNEASLGLAVELCRMAALTAHLHSITAELAAIREARATAGPNPGEHDSRLRDLTPREREVLQLIGLGRTNAEIAEALVVSASTVRHHISAIFAKLDTPDRVRAVILARESGLVPEARG